MTGEMRRVPVHLGVDRARFEAEIVPAGRPAMMKGLVAEWPAVKAAAGSSAAFAAYLGRFDSGKSVRAFFGAPGMGGRFTYADDLKSFNHEQRATPLKALVDQLLQGRARADAQHLYAGGVPMLDVLPGMAEDNPAVLLDPGKERLTSLWIGNRSTTAAHWDLPQNLACVVAGRRRFTLFPPEQIANLYVGPLDFTLAGQPISLVDVINPDFEKHPKFREALDEAEVADLEPGDALYLPSLWWHHVQSLDDFGVMVNLWWRDGPEYMTTPLLTLFHSLLTLRDLPRDERMRWRAFFDHYVFQTGEDPVEHLPVEGRGVLAPMNASIQQRLKAILLRSLQR